MRLIENSPYAKQEIDFSYLPKIIFFENGIGDPSIVGELLEERDGSASVVISASNITCQSSSGGNSGATVKATFNKEISLLGYKLIMEYSWESVKVSGYGISSASAKFGSVAIPISVGKDKVIEVSTELNAVERAKLCFVASTSSYNTGGGNTAISKLTIKNLIAIPR